MPDFRDPDHLPNRRRDRQPPHPSWLPRQQAGVSPQMIGRYPDYDVMSAADTWDHATKKVVLARLDALGPLRFFTAEEDPTLRAFCDTVMAQDGEPRVPVAEFVDDKLAAGRLDGYQYADMPDDRDTWRITLAGLDHTAIAHSAAGFAAGDAATREAIIDDFAHARLAGGPWEQVDVAHAWSVCLRSVLTGFYSHPWAWNEIGFGGPAYPRGFMRLGPTSTTEPFERHGATSEDPAEAVQNGLGADG
ncbi:MAG: gluconate 2-dehydrogenase subunit 3 family protein [Jatrophihabitans sp.]